jgi:DNA mismatch endonuclease (patch repair protein)
MRHSCSRRTMMEGGADSLFEPCSDQEKHNNSASRPTPGRSRNMAAIRRTDTKPELALRSELHKRGLRFRKDLRLDLGGAVRPRPDIVFTRARVAVFVDGCFWHQCPEHSRAPRQNAGYWSPKLARNVERDRSNDEALHAAGWTVVRLWEHVRIAEAVDRVLEVLTS